MEIKNVDISKIDLEISDCKWILMQERSIHNSDGPWPHRVIDWNDLNIGISSMNLINILSNVWSDKIVISIFSEQSYFSMMNHGERNIHVIFNFSYCLLWTGIDVVEIVDQIETYTWWILNTIYHNYIFISDPYCIKAFNMGIILYCCCII